MKLAITEHVEQGEPNRTASPERPEYSKVLYKGPPEHATPLFLVRCDEGWRESIVCEGMYEWAADWLVVQLQGKPYAKPPSAGVAC